jgi:MYXO-CTERM domain-containing protein
VRALPQGTECDSSDHACDLSRIAGGTEYRIDVTGPSAMAIHVIAARGSNASVGAHTQLTGDGYRGVVIPRASSPVAVITNDAPSATPASSLSYTAPAGALHVVVDAPVDANGKSDVTAAQDGSNCRVQVTPHAGSSGGYDGAPLIVRLSSSCEVQDDGAQTSSSGGSSTSSGSAGTGGSSTSSGTGGTATSSGTAGTSAGTGDNATSSGGSSSDSSSGGTSSDDAGEPSATGGSTTDTGSGGSSGSSAQGGTTSAGTGGTAGAAGRRHRRFSWQQVSSALGVKLSTQTVSPGEPEASDLSNVSSEDAGGGCSVASTSTGGPGSTLAGLVLGALAVLRQRRRRIAVS